MRCSVNISAALDELQYRAPSAQTGGVILTVTANDLGNTGAGGPLTDSKTVVIDVVAKLFVNLTADTNVDGTINSADGIHSHPTRQK